MSAHWQAQFLLSWSSGQHILVRSARVYYQKPVIIVSFVQFVSGERGTDIASVKRGT